MLVRISFTLKYKSKKKQLNNVEITHVEHRNTGNKFTKYNDTQKVAKRNHV